MQGVVDDLHQSIKESNAIVTWNSLPTIAGDTVQLPQLFRHLIENSIRFRSETPLTIHVFYEASEIDHTFIVSDNGIGIDKKDHENAFKMFRRVGIHESGRMGLGVLD